MRKLFCLLLSLLLVLSLVACSSLEPAPEETVPELIEYRVGEEYANKNVRLSYIKCHSNWKGYDEFSIPAEGYKYVCLEFEVENVGKSDEFISYFDFYCYADNVECEAYILEEDCLSATLSPGRIASGNIYFQVPVDSQEIEVEYHVNLLTEEKVIFVVE